MINPTEESLSDLCPKGPREVPAETLLVKDFGVTTLVLPQCGCATLRSLFSLSRPQFPSLEVREVSHMKVPCWLH